MSQLETFPNPRPDRDYVISHVYPEFTSMCPKTGMPDFATITIDYIADETCVELKSLKYYYHDYRNQGIFFEAVTNKILDDLVEACNPRWMEVVAEFNVRGGIASVINAEYTKEMK